MQDRWSGVDSPDVLTVDRPVGGASTLAAVVTRLRPAAAADVVAALARRADGTAARDDERLLVKHFLALLAAAAPGASVEVRVPPHAVAQCVAGARHARGTPPAVVETDGDTWIGLATGVQRWADAVAEGRVIASGERSDLSSLLPLTASAPG